MASPSVTDLVNVASKSPGLLESAFRLTAPGQMVEGFKTFQDVQAGRPYGDIIKERLGTLVGDVVSVGKVALMFA